jgi:hypothetical protein
MSCDAHHLQYLLYNITLKHDDDGTDFVPLQLPLYTVFIVYLYN